MTEPLDEIVLAPEAEHDLVEMLTFLAERDPRAAVAFHDALDATMSLLARRILEGRPVTLRSGLACRRVYEHPAVIYDRREPGVVIVARVYHHARVPLE